MGRTIHLERTSGFASGESLGTSVAVLALRFSSRTLTCTDNGKPETMTQSCFSTTLEKLL